MLLYNAHKNSQGFTMVEILTVVIFASILAAIGTPSFLSLFNKNKVNDAVSQLPGVLEEAQREAIRRGKKCLVALTPGTQPKLTSNCFKQADYTIRVRTSAIAGATTIFVDSLPITIPTNTGLVFSGGATGVVSENAAASVNPTSLTLSGGIPVVVASGEIIAFRALSKEVVMATNLEKTNLGRTPPLITFSFKGNTVITLPPGADSAKFVFNITDGSIKDKKCLAISNGTGIMRTGKYSGSISDTADVPAGTCTASP